MDATVAAGLVVAALAWSWLFTSPRDRFWPSAAASGLVIGAYGAAAQRSLLERLLTPTLTDLAVGVAGAALLYAVFRVGYAVLSRLVPSFPALVSDVYRFQGRTGTLALVLTLLAVGACEELFWRGLVQDRAGFPLALAGYTAVLLWHRNWALLLAAAVGGAFWGGLFAWRETLVAPIVCHALWDVAVAVWFPLGRVPLRRDEGA